MAATDSQLPLRLSIDRVTHTRFEDEERLESERARGEYVDPEESSVPFRERDAYARKSTVSKLLHLPGREGWSRVHRRLLEIRTLSSLGSSYYAWHERNVNVGKLALLDRLIQRLDYHCAQAQNVLLSHEYTRDGMGDVSPLWQLAVWDMMRAEFKMSPGFVWELLSDFEKDLAEGLQPTHLGEELAELGKAVTYQVRLGDGPQGDGEDGTHNFWDEPSEAPRDEGPGSGALTKHLGIDRSRSPFWARKRQRDAPAASSGWGCDCCKRTAEEVPLLEQASSGDLGAHGKKLPFRSLWELKLLYEKLGKGDHDVGDDEDDDHSGAQLRRCLRDLIQLIFRSELPMYLSDLNELKSWLQMEIDIGTSIQQKLLAMAISLFVALLLALVHNSALIQELLQRSASDDS